MKLNIAYHDEEWGVPQHDDRVLFEFLILEGAQAGLSWDTILRKRAAYREAFAEFRSEESRQVRTAKIERLMENEGIVRNRLKIDSADHQRPKSFSKCRRSSAASMPTSGASSAERLG